MMELGSKSKKKVVKPQSKALEKQHESVIFPPLQEGSQSQQSPLAKKAQNGTRLNPWSKAGLVALYEAGLDVGKGLSLPPHVIPYRFLGTLFSFQCKIQYCILLMLKRPYIITLESIISLRFPLETLHIKHKGNKDEQVKHQGYSR